MIKQFSMEESMIGFLSILYWTPPSKDMCSKTWIEIDMMKITSYTDIGFINGEDKSEVQHCLN
jgi:hypothetical protein